VAVEGRGSSFRATHKPPEPRAQGNAVLIMTPML